MLLLDKSTEIFKPLSIQFFFVPKIIELFFNNVNLIELFPNNKVLITKLYKLSKIIESTHWISFFEILLYNKNDLKKKLIKLQKKTEDNNLKKLIKLYI